LNDHHERRCLHRDCNAGARGEPPDGPRDRPSIYFTSSETHERTVCPKLGALISRSPSPPRLHVVVSVPRESRLRPTCRT
jgi:hypothetical protein